MYAGESSCPLKICPNILHRNLEGGVSRPSMSAYVLSFLDSMRQRTWFLGHWRTLADIDGHWRTWTDIGGHRRTLADLDGHWWTLSDKHSENFSKLLCIIILYKANDVLITLKLLMALTHIKLYTYIMI